MVIPYAAPCGTCKEQGKDSRLQRDLSEPGVIFCVAGHKFEGPDIEEYLDAFSVEEKAPLPQAVPAAVVEKSFDRALEMTPPPPELYKADSVPGVKDRQAPVMAAAPAATAVAELPEVPKPAVALQPKKAVKELPGGALEITVTIPDPHSSYLTGEAEFRGQSVQTYFQQMVEHGLDARWFY